MKVLQLATLLYEYLKLGEKRKGEDNDRNARAANRGVRCGSSALQGHSRVPSVSRDLAEDCQGQVRAPACYRDKEAVLPELR